MPAISNLDRLMPRQRLVIGTVMEQTQLGWLMPVITGTCGTQIAAVLQTPALIMALRLAIRSWAIGMETELQLWALSAQAVHGLCEAAIAPVVQMLLSNSASTVQLPWFGISTLEV